MIKIYLSLIVALGFSFSFSFFFFLQVKKAAMVYVAILFFSGEKKTKKPHKYRYHRPECLWGVLFKMATTTIVKKTIEELKELLSRYVKQNFPRNEL